MTSMSLPAALEALKRKDYAKARALIEAQNPRHYDIQHYLIKGLAEMAMADWPAAETTFGTATRQFPFHSAFWLNRGMAEENLGKIDFALASYEQGVTVGNPPPEIYGNLSNLYRQKKRFSESVTMAHKALEGGAERSATLNTLGLALQAQGHFKEAEEAYKHGLEHSPQNPQLLLNYANLAVDQQKFAQAWNFFKEARAVSDSALLRFNEATARLLVGDFKKGWDLFESRLDLPGALRVHPQCPRWQGESLAGKCLLIIAEQGYGDVIQFCRFGKLLGDHEIIWAVPAALKNLLKRSLKGKVVADTEALPTCDFYVPIMSLPLITKTWEAFAPIPYLFPRAEALKWSAKDRKKIGVTWQGSRGHAKDHERSIPVSHFKSIFEAVDADFYACTAEETLGEIGDLPLKRLPLPIKDFDDTAACVAQMDVILSVDTAVAHLAGALDIPTIVLLPFSPDWRWGTESRTPWYPRHVLKRQKTYGKWDDIIRECGPFLIEKFDK